MLDDYCLFEFNLISCRLFFFIFSQYLPHTNLRGLTEKLMNLWIPGSLVPVFQSHDQKIYTYISVFTLPPGQGLDTDWSLIARINSFCI